MLELIGSGSAKLIVRTAHNATGWPTLTLFGKRSVINNIGACVMAMDAVCVGLLAAGASVWEGTHRERHVSTAVIALQLFTLIGELSCRIFFMMVMI